MAPPKPDTALIKRQFVYLGRPPPTSKTAKPCERFRCKHCTNPTWESAAASPSRLHEYLNSCKAYQKTLQQQQPSLPPPPPQLTQKTLQESGIKAIPKDEKNTLDMAATTAIITDGRPFCLFESEAFHAFFHKLRPGWKPVTYAQVVQRQP